jgi:hypothetical protein
LKEKKQLADLFFYDENPRDILVYFESGNILADRDKCTLAR